MTQPGPDDPAFFEAACRYLDRRCGEDEARAFERLIAESLSHCRAYVMFCRQVAALREHLRERSTAAPEHGDSALAATSDVDREPQRSVGADRSTGSTARAMNDRKATAWRITGSWLAAAACVMIALSLGWGWLGLPGWTSTPGPLAAGEAARTLETRADPMPRASSIYKHGASLRPGTIWPGREALFSRVLMGRGVVLLIDESTELAFVDADTVHLLRGALTAEVPPAGVGFEVLTPRGTVVDLGTRFGVRVDPAGVCEVAVFDGRVSFDRLGAGAAGTDPLIELRDGQQLRVASDETPPRVRPLTHAGFLLELPDSAADAALARLAPTGRWDFDRDDPASSEIDDALLASGGVIGGSGDRHISSDLGTESVVLGGAMDAAVSQGAYTIVVWVRPDALGSQNILAASDGRGVLYEFGPQLRIRPTGRLEHVGRSMQSVQEASDAIAPGRWSMVVIRGDREGRMDLFVNGARAAPVRRDDGVSAWSRGDLWLSGLAGRRRDAVHHLSAFQGDLDQLAVFDRALSDAQIRGLFRAFDKVEGDTN